MDMSPKQYQAYLKSINPKSPVWKNMALAFLVGGAICCVGQALSDWYGSLGLNTEDAGTATSVSLVFLSALFTGLGLYHKLARHAGAHHGLCQLRGLSGYRLPGRGHHHRHRREDVHRGRAGDRVRHRRQYPIRTDPVGHLLTGADGESGDACPRFPFLAYFSDASRRDM